MASADRNIEIEQLMKALVEPQKGAAYEDNFYKLLEFVKDDPSQFTLRRRLSDGESEDAFPLELEHVDELAWRFENRDQGKLVCPDCPERTGCIRLPWYEWGRCVYFCWGRLF